VTNTEIIPPPITAAVQWSAVVALRWSSAAGVSELPLNLSIRERAKLN